MDWRPRLSLNGRELDDFLKGQREKSEYPEDMVKTNIVMPPRKKARDITINEGGSNPPKKERQEPPPRNKGKGKRPTSDRKTSIRDSSLPSWVRGFYPAVQAFLAETPLAAPSESGTAVSSEVTPGIETQDQSDAPGTDNQTDGAAV
uniref:Integrase core domain containing protein n=1 Tax=Solanum tuberosum TaxID=4113 RepID=M1D8T5_SOLTU